MRMKQGAVRLGAVMVLAVVGAAGALGQQAAKALDSDANDKYLWLEDVSSARSMAWVKAEDERSLKVLEADPRYAEYRAEAIKLAQAPDRLTYPQQQGGEIYNFWQDGEHVDGIYRKTSVADYLTAKPTWKTAIDYDALSKQDKVKWVSGGVNCLYPGDRYCLASLSAGGEDAQTMREFNLKTGTFVDGGFVLPHSKQRIGWLDKDTLLVARDWGPGTMTKSGYPFVVKEWKRGTPLESAKEVFRGQESDISVGGDTMRDAQGDSVTIFGRGVTFFESETYVMTASGPKKMGLPAKASLQGLMDGRLLVTIQQDWKPEGRRRGSSRGRCWS